MCLILFAHNTHPEYPLIVVANRDEFYARPTQSAQFWDDRPGLLAGRDLQAGGTWLGLTREGAFAAITNYREGVRSDVQHSRGKLTLDYLLSDMGASRYLDKLGKQASNYNGFNLLVGRPGDLHYFSNRVGSPQVLADGVYALGNGVLHDDWHKMRQAKIEFSRLISDSVDPRALIQLMADESRPGDEHLPDTGVGLEIERLLSARFIRSEHYGTRATTVVLVDNGGYVTFAEQNFTHLGKSAALREYSFGLNDERDLT